MHFYQFNTFSLQKNYSTGNIKHTLRVTNALKPHTVPVTRRSPEFSCFRNTTLCNKQNDKLGQKVPNDFFKFLTSLQKANIPLLKNWNWPRFLVWQMINTRTMSFSPWKLSTHPLSQSDDNNVKRYTFRKFYRHGYIYFTDMYCIVCQLV